MRIRFDLGFSSSSMATGSMSVDGAPAPGRPQADHASMVPATRKPTTRAERCPPRAPPRAEKALRETSFPESIPFSPLLVLGWLCNGIILGGKAGASQLGQAGGYGTRTRRQDELPPIGAVGLPGKVGNEWEVVGADIRPNPGASGPPRRIEENVIDPQAVREGTHRRDLGAAEAQPGLGEGIAVARPRLAVDAAVGRHVEVAGQHERTRQIGRPLARRGGFPAAVIDDALQGCAAGRS